MGAAGEERAAAWYREHGYEVLDRNWRCRTGEIDLVARRARELVFCEVKTRSGDRYGRPFEAVGRAKQLRIRRLAAEWLRSRRPVGGAAYDVRFDVASVVAGRVEIVEGAF